MTTHPIQYVTAADGTRIAFTTIGVGPPLAAAGLGGLTAREVDVLRLVARWRTKRSRRNWR